MFPLSHASFPLHTHRRPIPTRTHNPAYTELTCPLPSPPTHPHAASNVFSLGQTTLLKIPFVKQALGLPDLSQLKSGKPDVGPGKPVQTFAKPPPRPAPAAAAAEAPAAAAEAGAAPSKPQFATKRPAKPAQTYAQPPRQKKK